MTEPEEIADLLASYQRAVQSGDWDRLAGVFHPDATVCYPDRDTGLLVSVAAAVFAEETAALVAAGTTVKETTRAQRIDIAGSVSTVRVDFGLQIGDDHYLGTDFFSLAKLGDRWRITQKLYDMEPASKPG